MAASKWVTSAWQHMPNRKSNFLAAFLGLHPVSFWMLALSKFARHVQLQGCQARHQPGALSLEKQAAYPGFLLLPTIPRMERSVLICFSALNSC